METTLLFLAACLMFSGVHSESQSMSCSTVNGKTICNKQTSDGNSAMASSQAQFGGDSSFQRTYAGAGSRDNWDSSSQTLNGGYPDGFYNPPPSYDYYGNQESPGSFGGDSAAVYSTDYPDTGVATGIFGGPFTGVSSFVSSGSPNFFTGSQAGGGAFAGGFAAAGNVPFFSSGVNYPAQDSSSSSGGAPAQGSGYAGSVPVPSNPFDFVRGFMGGGGPAAGAFAGAGFFPLGRR